MKWIDLALAALSTFDRAALHIAPGEIPYVTMLEMTILKNALRFMVVDHLPPKNSVECEAEFSCKDIHLWMRLSAVKKMPALDSFFSDQSCKMAKGTIERPFCIIGKAAAGKLPHLQMILNALAANPFSLTWVIAAVAVAQILILVTDHA